MREIVFVDVDTQFDFMKPGGALYVGGAEVLLANLGALTRLAERNGILIISSADSHKKNDPEFRQFPPHCIQGTAGQKKIPQTLLNRHIFLSKKIASSKELFNKIKGYGQTILEKDTYDVFCNHNLPRLLRPFRIAFVYGVALDYCVKYAVLGLLQVGLEVYLVSDATKAIDAKYAEILKNYFRKSAVRFIRTKDTASKIRRLLGEQEAKILS